MLGWHHASATSATGVKLQDGLQEDVGTVFDILRARQFFGRVADAANAGDEDHANGANAGDLLSVVSRAAGHKFGGESQLFGNTVNQLLKACIGQCRMYHQRFGEAEGGPIRSTDFFGFRANGFEHLHDLLFVEVAQLESECDFAGDNVVGAGFDLDPAHRSDLAAGDAGDDLVHLLDEAGAGEKSVVALRHGRGAGVIGEAFDRNLRVQDADDALDHADIDLLLLERAALLDVQLEVAGDAAGLALHLRYLRGIAADESDPIADSLATLGDSVEQLFVEAGADGMAADGAALFVLKNDDLQRMTKSDVLLVDNLRDFDGGERSDVAVVIAAFRDRVNVRADDQRLERGVRARARADDVSSGIDGYVKAGLAHQTDCILPALPVGLGICDAAHSALRICTVARERLEVTHDPWSLHAQLPGVCLSVSEEWQEQKQNEQPAIHGDKDSV
jgi:hypothetical protein